MLTTARRFGLRALLPIGAAASLGLSFPSLWVVATVEPAALPINVIYVVVGGSFIATGWIIGGRRPENLVGPVILVLGVLFQYFAIADAYVRLPGPPPGAAFVALAVWLADGPFFALFSFLLLVFPTGRILAPRWRAVVGLDIAVFAVFIVGRLFGAGPLGYYTWLTSPFAVEGFPAREIIGSGYVLGAFAILASTASLVVRWRRAGPQERAQLKWVAASGSAFVAALIVYIATYDEQFDPTRSDLTGTIAICVAILLFPASVGIAVLRYRLYEIDRIISRSLAYAALTAALLCVYLVGFAVIQALIAPFTNGGDPIAVATSTLVVFALFQPLRRRIQHTMDRRFNRARYDAGRTVAVFSAQLRDTVDVGALCGELAAAIGSSVQPTTLGIWLRTGPGDRRLSPNPPASPGATGLPRIRSVRGDGWLLPRSGWPR